MTDFDQQLALIATALKTGSQRLTLTGLTGSSPAFLLTRLIQQTDRLFIVATADADAADELFSELRFYAGKPEEILLFPAWDSPILDAASPHPDLTGTRLNTLLRLTEKQARVVVAPYAALAQKIMPRRCLKEVSQYLLAGEEVEHTALLEKLVKLGYSPVPLVEDRGSFAARGGILDIFPPHMAAPVRIEFFGDFVETIRTFDPLTQRSLQPLEELFILPSREVILTPEVMKEFPARLKKLCDDIDIPLPRRRELLEQLGSAIYPPGIENLLPLFHGPLETLFDYTGDQAVTVLVDPDAVETARSEWQADLENCRNRALEREAIICDPAELFLSGVASEPLNLPGLRITIPKLELLDDSCGELFRFETEQNGDLRLTVTPDGEGAMKPLADRLHAWRSEQSNIIIACHQKGQAQRLSSLLEHHDLQLQLAEKSFAQELSRRSGSIALLTGELCRGFRLPAAGLVVIAEEELFGKRTKRNVVY